MKTRIIVSAILLPAFFAVLFFLPPYFLTIVISAISAIAAYELLTATKVSKNKRILVYTIISAALTPFAVLLSTLRLTISDQNMTLNFIYGQPGQNLELFTLLMIIFFILTSLLLIEYLLTFRFSTAKVIESRTYANKNKQKSNSKTNKAGKAEKSGKDPTAKPRTTILMILISVAAAMVIPYMLSTLIFLKTMPAGHLIVLLPIVVTMMTDSGAYFVGVKFGKKKPFPKISPNKTVEGYIFGAIIGMLSLVIYGVILQLAAGFEVNYPILVLYGLLGAVITEAGDLIFSLIKRKCEIKDYGKLIPGHGGALDRFDSMIFSAPTIYLLVISLPAFS